MSGEDALAAFQAEIASIDEPAPKRTKVAAVISRPAVKAAPVMYQAPEPYAPPAPSPTMASAYPTPYAPAPFHQQYVPPPPPAHQQPVGHTLEYQGYLQSQGAAAAAAATGAMKQANKYKPKSEAPKKRKTKGKTVRCAAGQVWEDQTLADWPDNDYRIFVGDLGNDCTDENLAQAFGKYPSFAKARVVRDKHTMKSKGFGFVSFLEAEDYIRAMKEMNGKYIANRPVKLRKSSWKDRSIANAKNKGMKLLH